METIFRPPARARDFNFSLKIKPLFSTDGINFQSDKNKGVGQIFAFFSISPIEEKRSQNEYTVHDRGIS